MISASHAAELIREDGSTASVIILADAVEMICGLEETIGARHRGSHPPHCAVLRASSIQSGSGQKSGHMSAGEMP